MSKDKEITSKPEISAKAAVTIGVAIGLTPEERSIFMEDAIKEKSPYEILLRDSFKDDKLIKGGFKNLAQRGILM